MTRMTRVQPAIVRAYGENVSGDLKVVQVW